MAAARARSTSRRSRLLSIASRTKPATVRVLRAGVVSVGEVGVGKTVDDAGADGHGQVILSAGPDQTYSAGRTPSYTTRVLDRRDRGDARSCSTSPPRPANRWASLTRRAPLQPAVNHSTKLDDHATEDGHHDYDAHHNGEGVRVRG